MCFPYWVEGQGTVTPEMMLINKAGIYTILQSGKNKKTSLFGDYKAKGGRENKMTTCSMEDHSSLRISTLP